LTDYRNYINLSVVTFDPVKRDLTLDQRGLDFARALEIFDEVHVTETDDRKAYGELRLFTVGYLDERMVVLVWTPRDGACRVISLRKANDREREVYQERLGR
jgi:hypothetical protein